MRKNELMVGDVYIANKCPFQWAYYSKLTTEIKMSSYDQTRVDIHSNGYKYFYPKSRSIVLEFLGLNSGYGSVHRVVEILEKNKEIEIEIDDIILITEHTGIVLYEGKSGGLSPRQRTAKRLKLLTNQKKIKAKLLKKQLDSLNKEVSKMDKEVEKLELFPSDEAEQANRIFKLISEKKNDCLTTKDIEEALKVQ